MITKTLTKLAAISLMTVAAQAYTITPNFPLVDTGDKHEAPPSFSGLTLLYKGQVGGSDEGTYAGSYTTTFSNSPSDPEDALIEKDATGDAIPAGSAKYLLVKDGEGHEPSWYLFDASSWNGVVDIDIQDFWAGTGKAGGGGISHVALWGGTVSTPDGGATAALLGLGILGLGAMRRKLS